MGGIIPQKAGRRGQGMNNIFQEVTKQLKVYKFFNDALLIFLLTICRKKVKLKSFAILTKGVKGGNHVRGSKFRRKAI
jgi:hypothetical protein